MTSSVQSSVESYQMKFDVCTIKHLGLQMYSTLPPVIGELVANGWDANATKVEIEIPETPINEQNSEIVIRDNGIGMSDEDVRNKYLIVGRDRREVEQADRTPPPRKRKVMGRKGIGKFSAFGIAKEIVVESVNDEKISHFRMNYDELLAKAEDGVIEFPRLDPSGTVIRGTTITLKHITKFKTRRIPIKTIRRGLARRFAVIGAEEEFEVVINGVPISPEDRDLKRLLDTDMDGDPYLWEYSDEEVKTGTGWTVSGWIGALNRTTPDIDGIDRGIVLMARGKLVQEPFVFSAVVGQQYALSYLIGEIHAEFVDEVEDTIGTTRNSLVWDTDANEALRDWGRNQVNRIAREWAEKRSRDNERSLEESESYQVFRQQAKKIDNGRALGLADRMVRQTIRKNPTAKFEEIEPVINTCLDFLQFDAFWEIVQELTEAELEDTANLLRIFREWQLVEAREMARVTEGRITTIEKLHKLIETDALEVPTLHDFLKEFPWVIDPRWTLVADEIYYSELLRKQFPEKREVLKENRRIDFLCVREGTDLVVVEIKRPKSRVSKPELEQIEEYVIFVRDHIESTTDPEYGYREVTGYLLCGDLVNTAYARQKSKNLRRSQIYVRRYADLLEMVKKAHREFLDRYSQLQEVKQRAAINAPPPPIAS